MCNLSPVVPTLACLTNFDMSSVHPKTELCVPTIEESKRLVWVGHKTSTKLPACNHPSCGSNRSILALLHLQGLGRDPEERLLTVGNS
mmetsp:Transcript_4094/g.7280  ORF Transcript_4094/g.7280 Transcript_4094/m.7280 type:complete len:88 (-) Transcript_4094:34-297(-)